MNIDRSAIAAILTFFALAPAATEAPPVLRAVAFTFDDLPSTRAAHLATIQETTTRLLRTLAEERVPATGFVNEINLLRGPSWLHSWMLAKGLPIQVEPSEPAFVLELFSRPQP